MLLSNRHQFLFVHIAKTGGSSIRAVLGRLAWGDALQLPTLVCHRLSHFTGHRIATKLPRHAAAVAAQEMLVPSHFDSLFKFAFVRNPWDRMVSAFHHFERENEAVLKDQHISSFHDFAKWIVEDSHTYRGRKQVFVAAIRRAQVEHLIDLKGARIVDFVGRYENLAEDFRVVCGRIGTPLQDLPHKRKSHRKNDFRQHYDDTTAELVGSCYQADADSFDYRFDSVGECVGDAPACPEQGWISC
jgi:hypothetical protein